MQQQQQQQQMAAYAASTTITTELIQKYLDENKQLILAILDNQNLGQLNECATYQAKLQQNLMYLAAIADAQPQAVQSSPRAAPVPSMQPAQQYLQQQQQQQQQLMMNQRTPIPQYLQQSQQVSPHLSQHLYHNQQGIKEEQQEEEEEEEELHSVVSKREREREREREIRARTLNAKSVSSTVGCLIPNRCSKHGDSAAAALGIHYCDPPPDEGLGHSFYYVRPATFGSDSSTPLEFSFESGSGMAEPDGAAAIGSGGAATVTQADQGSGFGRGEVPGEQQHKRSATMRVSWERVPGTTSRRAPPGSSGSETSRPKSMSETSFKVISGASELKGLLWDQDDIGFDSLCPGGSPEEKEASGAVDFPSVVGSDVEGDDEIQWQQQGSCGNNSLCQQLDSKPLDHFCRTAVEMWEDSEGVLNEGTLGENVEAKHSPHLDLNGCRGEETIETLRDIDFLGQRINLEHATSEQAACGGTFEKPQPVERLQQKKMRVRGDIEDKSSQEAQDNERSSVDHGAVLEALERALKATEAAFLEMADRVLHENPELMVMGSCVLVMLMKDEDVYIMNVGDSRAVVAQQHSKSRGSLSHVGHAQPNGLTVEEPPEKNTGVQDTLLQLELDKIIEEAPTESKGLKLKNGSRSLASDPAPGSLLLDALQLSSDHSTSILEEVLRIKAEHPNDENAISNNRVKGQLKVTRAFGAGFLKQPVWNNALLKMFRCDFEGTDPYITCNPFLHHHRLGPQDHFLVLSSDGLYQYLSNEEVVSRVQWFMQNFPDGDPAQHLIEELLFRAAKKNGMDFHELLDIPQGDRRKYHDDVYVMVISLEGRIWKSTG
ncbi:unnamed protein product [Sphagnum compactum]